jgi:hypothetical protein
MYDPKFPEINLYNPPWQRPFKVLNLLYYIQRKQEYTQQVLNGRNSSDDDGISSTFNNKRGNHKG